MGIEELINTIRASTNFAEIRNSGMLPDPDSDDGYYFISYSHADYKSVLTEIIAFRERGVKIWYDRGLESGKSWISDMRKKISSYYCKGVIFYLSHNYFASQSCITELLHVMQEKKNCLFIFLDDTYKSFSLPEKSSDDFLSFISQFPSVSSGTPVEEKIKLLATLPPPELFSYYYSTETIFKIFHIHRCMLVRLNDRNLQSVTVPPFRMYEGRKYRIKEILPNAFENCEMLEEVIISDGWWNIHDGAFVNCPSLRKVCLGTPKTLGLKIGSIGQLFERCGNMQEIKYPHGLLWMNGTFAYNDAITEYNAPKNVWLTGTCFLECLNLRSVVLNRLPNLGIEMFRGCISLEKITIPRNSKVREVCERQFMDCTALKEIELPKRVAKISDGAFAGCKSLKSINLPAKVKVVAQNAFDGCNALRVIKIEGTSLRFLHTDKGKVFLDELFPAAEQFYLRKRPPASVFKLPFEEIPCDIKGYILYRKVMKEKAV